MRARLFLRRLASVVWTAVAIVLIGAGVIVGLGRLLLPFAPHFHPEIEAWLAEELDRPVAVGELRAEWSTTGPLIRLEDVTLVDQDTGQTSVTLGEAEVALNLLAWLSPELRLADFRIANIQIVLERTADNELRVMGFGDQGDRLAPVESAAWLLEQGSISVVDSSVDVLDRRRDLILRFRDVDLTLDNRGASHRIVGSARVPADDGGRIEFRAALQGDPVREGIRDARLYARGEGVALRQWLQGSAVAGAVVLDGRADFEIWGEVSAGRAEQVQGRLELAGIELRSARAIAGPTGVPVAPTFAAETVSGDFRWRSRAGGWQLDLALEDWLQGGRRWEGTGLSLARDGDVWRFGSEHLRLQELVEAATVFDKFDASSRQGLLALSPAGELRRVRGRWDAAAPPTSALHLDARLEHLAWQQMGRWPALAGVSGHLRVTPDSGSLKLQSQRLTMRFPALFRQPVSMGQVAGRLLFRRAADGWRLSAPRVRGTAGGGRTVARLELVLPDDGTRPFIDLRARVSGGDVTRGKRFMPVGIMHPDLVKWLDEAVADGSVETVRTMVYGDLAHWPFDGGAGRLEIRGSVTGADLDYRDGWPRVTNARADLLFQGRSMRVTAEQGRVFDAEARRIVATIDDLERPWLDLDVSAEGPAPDLLRFLRESPLSEKLGPYLRGLEVAGATAVRSGIRIPLKKELGEPGVDGTVRLSGLNVQDDKWGIAFDDVHGRIQFDEKGFETRATRAVFRGEPVELSLRVGRDERPGVDAAVRISGRLPPQVLLRDHPALAPLMTGLEGAALCNIQLTVPSASSGTLNGARLRITSNMAGVAVNLPAPLDKPVEERVPVTLEMPVPFEGGVIDLEYGERLAGRFQPLAEGGPRAALHFGSGLPALPDATGVTVTGSPARLDLDAWVTSFYVTQGGGGALPPLESVDLEAGRVTAMQRQFNDVALKVAPGPDGWRADIESREVSGTLRLPLEPGAGLVGEFSRLHLPSVREGVPTPAINPRRLPPLHLLAEDFSLGETSLGRARLEAYPTSNGMRVDMVKAEAPSFTLVGDGRWTAQGGEQTQQSDFDLTITAENLGAMLSNFGYAGLVRDGQTLSHLDVNWPGPPTDFALERLDGELEVTVGPGRILPVEPGAGRVFGLLSLQQLPRRLTLDFSDLFNAGLSFDSIQGTFRFDQGDAYTSDFSLTGPSAFIQVAGRVGLAERTYDQHVTVYPSVGSTLPLVGALAGGPTGAAAMFLLQNLFQKQISQMTAYHYAVTGPWDEPTIRLLETEPPPDVAASERSRPGGG